jgi:phosphoserine phosphatase
VLTTWRDGAAKKAITEFVEQAKEVPADERMAAFDNDGTLWCEKPVPIQLDFILRRLVAMADEAPELRSRQPWKAAHENDLAWFGSVVAAHYAGDDTQLPALAAGVLEAYAGTSVEDFEAQANEFLTNTRHPTLGRPYVACAYAPMVELLAYLRANGFGTYIASGGGRDFMRPISHAVYGVPREQVIGSTATLSYEDGEHGGTIRHQPVLDYLDDGPEKPIRIWRRTGRRPLLAAGNANGDIPMLRFTHHPDKPTLRLLVLHDDPDREFAYTTGAEQALEQADRNGWTIISIRDDWLTVF